MSIPASKFVTVNPSVLGVAGAALALSGLLLTTATDVPIGTVASFPDQSSVGSYFGASSAEYTLAGVYFGGFDGSTAKPGAMLFSQYPTASVAAYLRGGSLAAMTLTQLKAITAGVMTVTVDGVLKTSTSIDLSSATSFSNAATIIAAAFTGVTVAYDAQHAAFKITSGTTGASSALSFAAGAIATALKMTQATSAVTSQGAVAYTPGAAMDSITAATRNWASFTTTFEPLLADKIAFATWTAAQNSRFAYSCWDTDANAIVAGNTSALGPQLAALSLGGTVPHTADANVAAALGVTMTDLCRPLAVMAMGYGGALDFGRTNGRTTFAYRSVAGVTAGVTDLTVYNNLVANGYNCYANVATSAAQYRFVQPGQVSGRFAWLDSYFNEINLNAELQQNLIDFMVQSGSIPYNNFGYSAIETVMSAGAVADALNFGSIRPGVTLSAAQIIAVNAATGVKADTVLGTRGWYISIKDPGATVRAQRGSPVITLYYMDGGSIQQITLASILVQ